MQQREIDELTEIVRSWHPSYFPKCTCESLHAQAAEDIAFFIYRNRGRKEFDAAKWLKELDV